MPFFRPLLRLSRAARAGSTGSVRGGGGWRGFEAERHSRPSCAREAGGGFRRAGRLLPAPLFIYCSSRACFMFANIAPDLRRRSALSLSVRHPGYRQPGERPCAFCHQAAVQDRLDACRVQSYTHQPSVENSAVFLRPFQQNSWTLFISCVGTGIKLCRGRSKGDRNLPIGNRNSADPCFSGTCRSSENP